MAVVNTQSAASHDNTAAQNTDLKKQIATGRGMLSRMVSDHSVSLSSENTYGRTQTVEGERCAHDQWYVGITQSWIMR